MTATIRASSLSASGMAIGLLAFASSTDCPFCNMGVITMKMINNTSITSTMGVTLMLELTFAPSFRTAKDIFLSRGLVPAHVGFLQEVIDEFAGRVVHLDVERFHLAREVVEHHHGGDGDEKTESGGNQGFRNTTGNGAKSGSFLFGDLTECVENSDNGAEQSDERSGGTDRGQAAQTTLQFGVNNGFGTFKSAFAGIDLRTGNFGRFAMSLKFLKTGGDNFGQMALLITLGHADGLVELSFTQGASHCGSELPRLFAGGVEGDPAVDHDAD